MKIVKVPKRMFLQRCKQRNVDPEKVKGCIFKEHESGLVEIDIEHKDYPHPTSKSLENVKKELFSNPSTNKTLSDGYNQYVKEQKEDIQEGVGAELKILLSYMNIKSNPNCSCNAKAKTMNKNGIQWCKDNKNTIIGWLEEEAKKRKLPFIRYGAKKILDLAIYRAEKKQKKN